MMFDVQLKTNILLGVSTTKIASDALEIGTSEVPTGLWDHRLRKTSDTVSQV